MILIIKLGTIEHICSGSGRENRHYVCNVSVFDMHSMKHSNMRKRLFSNAVRMRMGYTRSVKSYHTQT